MSLLDRAIQKVSFAEARTSSAEAMIEIARRRSAEERPARAAIAETERTAQLIARARDIAAHRSIDKTA